jgi:hypothetical protein
VAHERCRERRADRRRRRDRGGRRGGDAVDFCACCRKRRFL